MNKKNIFLGFLSLILIPKLASAHIVAGSSTGFLHGLSHPFSGLDHLIAMIAVGLWASQIGGRAKFVIPAIFVSIMSLGALAGFSGVFVPFVEKGIVLSVLILGVLIGGSYKFSNIVNSLIVAAFAFFHGHAHGTELSAGIDAMTYAIGFIIATITLHIIGIGVGMAFNKIDFEKSYRYSGVAIVMAGLYLLFT